MCYTGECRYEDYLGDCQLDGSKKYPIDAVCVIKAISIAVRENLAKDIDERMVREQQLQEKIAEVYDVPAGLLQSEELDEQFQAFCKMFTVKPGGPAK